MANLEIYDAVRGAPKEALREIKAGRLRGKTDINPMWRIEALTEQFGPCGIGWKYTITRQWLEIGSNGEISAFCNIDLYYKYDGEWSEAVPGTGGSSFVAKEKSGLYTSDECYKMALTDAISVACKALGFAADVYWDKDRTKYDSPAPKKPQKIDGHKVVEINNLLKQTKSSVPNFLKYYHVARVEDMSEEVYKCAEHDLMTKISKGNKNRNV
jgi:hypothetical protein